VVNFFNDNKFFLLKEDINNLLFQRNDLFSSRQKFLRKCFGRFLFTKFFIFFFKKKNISYLYYRIVDKELSLIRPFIKKAKKNKNILSIGCGLGGLEVLLQKTILKNSKFFLFERNFTSSKVVYGYDLRNREAYNSIKSTKLFVQNNSANSSKFNLFDIDTDKLPIEKFDIVVSLLSLDYHYPFDLYYKYLKKNSHSSTIFIFDTVRAEHFKKIFKVVKFISSDKKNIHSSSRLFCKNFR
jgi:SAM-dependent methyltransferase|tara:strand:- start:306 stop:1025 length:720 start_codon:yes stop_codon:yes gene_type:complete